MTLSVATTPGPCGPGSDAMKGCSAFSKLLCVYLGQWWECSYPSIEKQLVYSTASANCTNVSMSYPGHS